VNGYKKFGKFGKRVRPMQGLCRALGKGSNTSKAGKDDSLVRSKVLAGTDQTD